MVKVTSLLFFLNVYLLFEKFDKIYHELFFYIAGGTWDKKRATAKEYAADNFI